MRIPKLLAVVILFAAGHAFGHQDSIIPFNRGKLEGLPAKYQPASFSISERKMRVGGLSAIIPPCVWKHFEAAKETEFRFAASWYHAPSTLPPYIVISVHETKTRNRFELLINLDTLTPISLTHVIQTSNSSWSYQEIPLDEPCHATWSITREK